MGREKSRQRADDLRSFNEFDELCEIHGGGGGLFGHQTISRRSKDFSELNKMLSDITVFALRFAIFCLLVERAMIVLRKQILQEKRSFPD